MWFGTQDGLNRFDGYNVVVYKHIPDDSNSLPANSILAICEDAQTNLWVGTRIDGLSKYDRRKQTFTTFKHNLKDKNSLSNNSVSVILQDKEQNI